MPGKADAAHLIRVPALSAHLYCFQCFGCRFLKIKNCKFDRIVITIHHLKVKLIHAMFACR